LKNVFNKNKEFISSQYEYYYSSNDYFPHKYFNIDSFSLALQINIILILILYSQIFEGCLIKHKYLNELKDDIEKSYYLYSAIFSSVLLYTTIIYLVKLNDNFDKINYRLKNILNNWEIKPIQSIFISDDNLLTWKNININYEKLNNFSYQNIIYDNKFKENKICGKDSNGNDLYFTKDVECPINDIIITKDENFDEKGEYKKLKLKNNLFLYYTNKKIDGKIIIELKISSSNKMELNFEELEAKKEYTDFDIKSYSNIDIDDNQYLLAMYYIGINREISAHTEKIKVFENKLHKYPKFILTIKILLGIYYGVIPIWILIAICIDEYE
jgi:hypothetical protein